MMCARAGAVLLMLLVTPAPGLVHSMRQPQVPGATIHPKVDESHDRFFRKNFPDDHSPANSGHFDSHPYPTVQESDEYEKDYVTDRNDDGGYWEAQMKYDNLKNKLAKEKQDLVDAMKAEVEQKEDVAKAKAEEEGAEEEAKTAEGKVKAEEKAEEEGKAEYDAGMTEVERAEANLEKAEKKFEECEKMLEAAKAELKAAKEKAAEKGKEEGNEEVKVEEAKEEELEAEKKEETAEKKEEEEEAEYRTALKTYEEEKEDVEKVEAEMESAAGALKKFRKGDSHGAIQESGARLLEPLSLSLALVTLLALGLAPAFAPR